jgi:hypothetical protein
MVLSVQKAGWDMLTPTSGDGAVRATRLTENLFHQMSPGSGKRREAQSRA